MFFFVTDNRENVTNIIKFQRVLRNHKNQTLSLKQNLSNTKELYGFKTSH